MIKKIFLSITSQIFKLPITKKYRNFLMWPIATRILGKEYSEVLTLKAGFKMHAYMGDHLGREMTFYGQHEVYFWEPETTKLIERLTKNADCALVAGCHIGLPVMYLHHSMKPESKIFTFEPINKIAEVAEKNIRLNQAEKSVTLNRLALGAENKDDEFVIDGLRSHSTVITQKNDVGHEIQSVKQTTIDNFANTNKIEKIDFIMLDIEGLELAALKGAEETLNKKVTTDIIFEISHPQQSGLDNAEKIYNHLKPFGYRFFVINEVYDAVGIKNREIKLSLNEMKNVESFKHFANLSYFNVLATFRDNDNLTNLGVDLS